MNEDSVIDKNARPHRGAKRRERTRSELLAAARKVFSARGYHDASILDITEAANVGVGTFYLHFRDKEEAFNTLVEEVLHSLREQITLEVRQSGKPLLSQIIHAIFRHAYEQHDLFLIGLTGGGKVAYMFQMQDMIAEGLVAPLERFAARGMLENYDSALLARLVTGVILQGITWWFEQEEPDPDEMAEQIIHLLSQGLPAQLFVSDAERQSDI